MRHSRNYEWKIRSMRSNSCYTHTHTEHSTAFVIHKMNAFHIHWKRLRCLCDSHVVASIRCVHCGLHVWRAFLSPSVDRIGARRRLAAFGQVSPANGFAPNGRASALPSVVRVEFEYSQDFWVTRKTRKRFRFFREANNCRVCREFVYVCNETSVWIIKSAQIYREPSRTKANKLKKIEKRKRTSWTTTTCWCLFSHHLQASVENLPVSWKVPEGS